MQEQDHTTVFFSQAVYEGVVDADKARELKKIWEAHGAEVHYDEKTGDIKVSLSMFDWASLPVDVQAALDFGFL
jgi:hypothetical protein